MAKDKETKPKKYKSGLSLGSKDMVKVNLSFEQLVKKVVTVEFKNKTKENKEKDTSKK